MNDAANDDVRIPVLWVGAEEMPVFAANQMFITRDENVGDFYLTFGNVTPPPLVSTDLDELRAAAERIGYVPIRTVSRLAVAPVRLREFHRVLTGIIERMDEAEGR